MKNVSFICIMVLLFFFMSCEKDENNNGETSRRQITFAGVGDYGIFDPSLARDPNTGKLWMSYSEVDNSTYPANKRINTRLAYSGDSGTTWADSGSVINQATDQIYDIFETTWVYEVSSICYDANEPSSDKWKLVFHRYLALGTNRLFEHGWIGMKTASTPGGLASAAEIKLFTGKSYDADANNPPNPVLPLDTHHSDLNACLVFTEPSVFSTNNALYICMLGAKSSSMGIIFLVKYPYPAGPWEYKGTFLNNDVDAPAINATYDGFSAPSIYEKGGKFYLMVTPVIKDGSVDKYSGTVIFEITSLDSATIKRNTGIPEVINSVYGTADSFNGAAGYISQSTGSGILYSELSTSPSLEFKIFASMVNP